MLPPRGIPPHSTAPACRVEPQFFDSTSSLKIAYLFPGQGSQSIGMLADFHVFGNEIQDCLERASDSIRVDLATIVFQGPADTLNQTEITQPAIVAVSVGLYAMCQRLGSDTPWAAAGHSLGEYSALIAAGVLDFEVAIQVVHQRGKLMQSAVPQGTGGMAAVLGLADKDVKQICNSIDGTVEVANYNCPGQLVIAGRADDVYRATQICTERGARRIVPIAMSVPSHCSLLRRAGEEYQEVLSPVSFSSPGFNVYQNANARRIDEPHEIQQNLVTQLSSSVLWYQSIEAMIKDGVETFVECGPGKVLTGLMRRIDRNVKAVALSDRSSFEQFIGE